jgi:hypothetical protein
MFSVKEPTAIQYQSHYTHAFDTHVSLLIFVIVKKNSNMRIT